MRKSIMTCKNKEFKKPLSDFDKEFICLQIEKAIESYRSAVSLMAKVITVLLIINITLLGYSIVTKVSGIMFIGSLFPIMILYTAYESIKFSIPIVYTALIEFTKHGYYNPTAAVYFEHIGRAVGHDPLVLSM